MSIVIRRALVLLGGSYHGAVKLIPTTAAHITLPARGTRRTLPILSTVLYVRVSTRRGDVFVDSSYGPNARALLIRGYENDPNV